MRINPLLGITDGIYYEEPEDFEESSRGATRLVETKKGIIPNLLSKRKRQRKWRKKSIQRETVKKNLS